MKCEACGKEPGPAGLVKDQGMLVCEYCGCPAGEIPKVEYDVHFSLNGFFRKVEANSPEEAMTTVEGWLTQALPELEKHARTGLGIEVVEAVDPDFPPVTNKLSKGVNVRRVSLPQPPR